MVDVPVAKSRHSVSVPVHFIAMYTFIDIRLSELQSQAPSYMQKSSKIFKVLLCFVIVSCSQICHSQPANSFPIRLIQRELDLTRYLQLKLRDLMLHACKLQAHGMHIVLFNITTVLKLHMNTSIRMVARSCQ